MTDEKYAKLFKPELDFHDSQANIYRYRPINENNLTTIRECYLWFSFFKDVNDPFDGVANFEKKYYPDDVKQLVKRVGLHRVIPNKKLLEDLTNTTGSSWESEIKQLIEEYRKHFNMCCFSRVDNNVLMWSHYADSHKGMVLEFDYRKDIETLGQPYIVKYVSEFKSTNLLSGDPQSIIQLMCTKSDEWKYEQELRIVKPVEGNKLYYAPISLRRVIFGCETSLKDKELVKEALNEFPHIEYAVCLKDIATGNLTIIGEF